MRCQTCNLITRPDIARAKSEERCTCDAEFEAIFKRQTQFLQRNEQTIEELAQRLMPDPSESLQEYLDSFDPELQAAARIEAGIIRVRNVPLFAVKVSPDKHQRKPDARGHHRTYCVEDCWGCFQEDLAALSTILMVLIPGYRGVHLKEDGFYVTTIGDQQLPKTDYPPDTDIRVALDRMHNIISKIKRG